MSQSALPTVTGYYAPLGGVGAPQAPAAPPPPPPPVAAYGYDRLQAPSAYQAPAAPQAPGAWPQQPAAQQPAATYNAQTWPGTQPAPAPGVQNYTATNLGQGPIVQTGAAGMVALGAKIIPAGTSAAVGAASAIARNTNGSMVKAVAGIVESAGEPLVKLSWALIGNSFEFLGALVTFRFGDAMKAFGRIFGEGAVSLGALGKKVAQPVTLTAATAGGNKLGLGQAIGAGLSGGLKALKSSFIWAIPASAINAFIDYKYRDQTDMKRLGTNFAADVIGYTATGMAGAAAGAMVGSMTMPIIGTIVGAVVGIGLGLMHDKITRPMISDALHDAI